MNFVLVSIRVQGKLGKFKFSFFKPKFTAKKSDIATEVILKVFLFHPTYMAITEPVKILLHFSPFEMKTSYLSKYYCFTHFDQDCTCKDPPCTSFSGMAG